MPGKFLGEATGSNGTVLFDIEAPGGRVYTCNPTNVYEEETGKVILMHKRAEELAAQGYEIAVRNDGTFRVYNRKKHGERGGYIVRVGEHNNCSCDCPAFEKTGLCKHGMAVCSLLHNKAARAYLRGWKPGAVRYENLAARLGSDTTAEEEAAKRERREKFLRDRERDF